jgi:hypothetical protein
MRGMETKRSSALPILAAIVMLLVVMLGAYVGAYYGLCLSETVYFGNFTRLYKREWQATFFQPAAKADSLIRRQGVYTTSFEWRESYERDLSLTPKNKSNSRKSEGYHGLMAAVWF